MSLAPTVGTSNDKTGNGRYTPLKRKKKESKKSLTEEMEVPLIMIAKKWLYIFNVMYYANIWKSSILSDNLIMLIWPCNGI